MKEQNDMMMQAGCNVYSFTLDCVLQGITMKSKSVITVENDFTCRFDRRLLTASAWF